jgi:hypothetical protein
MLICPQQVRWPAPNVNVGIGGDKVLISGLHWEMLHKAIDELRSVVRKAWTCVEAISADTSLSTEAKRTKKARMADQLISELVNSKALSAAKEMITRQTVKLQENIAQRLKRAADANDVTAAPKLWDTLKQLSGAARLVWLNKQASNLSVAYLLLAPSQDCSGLSDSEVAFLRKKAETQAAPEVVKERDETLKALGEAERGQRAAIEQIRKAAGVTNIHREK